MKIHIDDVITISVIGWCLLFFIFAIVGNEIRTAALWATITVVLTVIVNVVGGFCLDRIGRRK